MIKVYIDDPVYLDTNDAQLELLDAEEVFVEIPDHKDYFVSQYARVCSAKRNRKRILKPFNRGSRSRANQLKPSYRFYSPSGGYKDYHAYRLVAKIFCENTDPLTKTEVHHIDKDQFNNSYLNLVWVSAAEHRLLEKGKMLFGIDKATGAIRQYESQQEYRVERQISNQQFWKMGKNTIKFKITKTDDMTIEEALAFLDFALKNKELRNILVGEQDSV
jgi:hypothetical protein